VKTNIDASVLREMPQMVPSDIPALPAQEAWVNLQDLGAKGMARQTIKRSNSDCGASGDLCSSGDIL
jgi:hypothetical protein